MKRGVTRDITVTAHYDDGTSRELVQDSGVEFDLSPELLDVTQNQTSNKYQLAKYGGNEPTPGTEEPTPIANPKTETGTSPVSFVDITNHWAKDAIERGLQKQIIIGYTDNTFLPNAPITRGEFVVILLRGLGLTSNEQFTFVDHIPVWSQDAVNSASEARILKLQSNTEIVSFDSSAIPTWARSAVSAITEEGLMSGYSDGTFRPNGLLLVLKH